MIDLRQADVDAEARRQLDRLIALGIGVGHSVGWLGLNRLEALGLLAACQHLGARFVPMNWRLSPAELADIARHAGLQALLHDEAFALLCDQVKVTVNLPQPLAPGHEPGDCMVVYTSGTTGQPKGAIHTVESMTANTLAAIEAQHLNADTRTLAVLPMFHVGGLCIQVLPTLAAGGCVRLHDRFDAQAWLHDVAHWRPTTSLLVPATMQAILDHPQWNRTDLTSLKFINCGSSVVPRPLIDAFFERGVSVSQVYGSTETGPVSIIVPLDRTHALRGKVGQPARHVEVRLVGVNGQDVGRGEVGEIWLRAPNLMRGYHREPHHPSFQHGWFHSGDLAWQDSDGWFEVVGRSKDMIISGGENIYPAEIENCFVGHPLISECAVVGLPDRHWGEVVVMVVVPRSSGTIEERVLMAVLQHRLARFKHPKRIVQRSSLPKTALGKVQKDVLRDQLLRDIQAS